jgi:hypothetical protein
MPELHHKQKRAAQVNYDSGKGIQGTLRTKRTRLDRRREDAAYCVTSSTPWQQKQHKEAQLLEREEVHKTKNKGSTKRRNWEGGRQTAP